MRCGACPEPLTRFVSAHHYCCHQAYCFPHAGVLNCSQPAGGWRARACVVVRTFAASLMSRYSMPRRVGGRTKRESGMPVPYRCPASPDRAARAHVARWLVRAALVQSKSRLAFQFPPPSRSARATSRGLCTSSRRARRRRLTRASNRNRCRSISRTCRCCTLLTYYTFIYLLN